MNRRRMMQLAGGSVAAGAVGALAQRRMAGGGGAGEAILAAPQNQAPAQIYSNATRGLPALKITNVKTILTSPQGGNYVVVKVETSEPGLYGVG